MDTKTILEQYKEELATAIKLKAAGKLTLFNDGDMFYPISFLPMPIDDYIARWQESINIMENSNADE